MYRLGLLVSIVSLLFFSVKAQSAGGYDNISSGDAVTAFKPSLALVVGILSIMFSLTFLLLIYAKFCHRPAAAAPAPFGADDQLNMHRGLVRSSSQFSGVDKRVIESLPFFRFSSLKGSKEGLECAVCISKFEEIEILRLLPKCKHAFHINCIDQWLEKHASCPLCRLKVSAEDPAIFAYSNSLRFLWNQQSELGDHDQDSDLELFVERQEEDHHRAGSSSRFSIGSSFRKTEKDKKEEESLMENQQGSDEIDHDQKNLHKFNHKIIVSDVVFKNRWSSVSSSDLMLLNSEMLNAMSSDRFSSLDSNNNNNSNNGRFEATREIENNGLVMNIKEEVERKRLLENKINNTTNLASSFSGSSSDTKTNRNHLSRPSSVQAEKRSMSEITAVSRFFFDYSNKKNRIMMRESCLSENNVKEERMRQLWLPIARRTVQWFANREKRSPLPQQNTRETTLDV